MWGVYSEENVYAENTEQQVSPERFLVAPFCLMRLQGVKTALWHLLIHSAVQAHAAVIRQIIARLAGNKNYPLQKL